MEPILKNDAVVLGVLFVVLAGIFITAHSENRFWKGFYRFVPALLLCYFVPALLNWPLGLISPDVSKLYFVASRYLLPACLILLCLSIDFKGIRQLGPKALIMFLTGTAGVILGGPIAILFVKNVFPGLIPVEPEALWKGMSTVAGSWIGGGPNQTAMKEAFQVDDNLFATFVIVDVLVANVWMAFLLYGANRTARWDRWFRADTRSIDVLTERVTHFQKSVARIPTTKDLILLLAIAFGGTGLSHWIADGMAPLMKNYHAVLQPLGLNWLEDPFIWLILVSTTVGLLLSLTRARQMEGAGASRIGSLFIYVLVATIGMKMNLGEIVDKLGLFVVGAVWMLVHAVLLFVVGKLIRAPFFFLAVGSQANIGGAASAPLVASAFNPALAPVGVLLAVLGYALGTYGALLCAYLMQNV